MKPWIAAALSIAVLTTASRIPAQDALPADLRALAPGEHWMGEPFEPARSVGKVWLIVMWGPGEPGERCVKQMVMLRNQLEPQMRRRLHLVFNVVNSEMSKADASRLIGGFGPAPTGVTVVNKAGTAPLWRRGYPDYALYDHTGNLRGTVEGLTPEGYDVRKILPKLTPLLEAAPWIDLGPDPFVRLKPLADRLLARQDLPATYGEIERHALEAADSPVRREARRLWTSVEREAERMLQEARDWRRLLPQAAQAYLGVLVREFTETSLVTKLEEERSKWKRDTDHQKRCEAEKRITGIAESLDRLPTCSKCRNRKLTLCMTCIKLRRRPLARIDARLRQAGNGFEDLNVYVMVLQQIELYRLLDRKK